MTPGVPAKTFRWFALLPHFKGKSRLEQLLERLVPLPPGIPVIEFPLGFRMALRSNSTYERGLYFRNCEPDTCATLRRMLQPGDIFADCGANLGFYSLLAASIVGPAGRVDAFEPTPTTYARLVENIRLNDYSHVVPHNLALGEAEGELAVFAFSDNNHGMNMVAAASAAGTAVGRCRVDTIDRLLSNGVMRRPKVMKIDVEGSELVMLRGAEGLLTCEAAPSLIIELSRYTSRRFGYTPEDVVRYLLSLRRFRIEWPQLGKRYHVDPRAPLPHYAAYDEDFGANYVFIPE